MRIERAQAFFWMRYLIENQYSTRSTQSDQKIVDKKWERKVKWDKKLSL